MKTFFKLCIFFTIIPILSLKSNAAPPAADPLGGHQVAHAKAGLNALSAIMNEVGDTEQRNIGIKVIDRLQEPLNMALDYRVSNEQLVKENAKKTLMMQIGFPVAIAATAGAFYWWYKKQKEKTMPDDFWDDSDATPAS